MFENWNRVLERNSRLANLLLFLVTVVVFAQTLGGVYSAIRIAALGRFSETPRFWEFSVRMLTVAVGLLGQHARLFFWPVQLTLFRSFDPDRSLRSLWPLVTLLALLLLLVRRKQREFEA